MYETIIQLQYDYLVIIRKQDGGSKMAMTLTSALIYSHNMYYIHRLSSIKRPFALSYSA